MPDTRVRVPKATRMLKDDHRKVKALFAEYDKLEDVEEAKKERLFQEIKAELTVHTQIEEEIFYPAVAMADDDEARMLAQEAREEHKIVKTLLAEIDALAEGDELECDAKMKVLKESVLHHAQEEEKEIFPVFEDLDKEKQTDVAERLMVRKGELESRQIQGPEDNGNE